MISPVRVLPLDTPPCYSTKPTESHRLLKTYRPEQQHMGMFIAGFPWRLYGTGTFARVPKDEERAVFYLNRFTTKLSRSLKFKKNDLSYYAALEDHFPGIGGTRPVRRHWHFLIACPENEYLESVAEQMWLENGILRIAHYNPELSASYYINKLVVTGAYQHERGLERLHYSGPADLLAATKENPYVPDRLKGMTKGEYLV